jgi:hypothetical protein
VLDILSAHPSTALFLSRKLVKWFLTPTPPESLVQRVAETYQDTGGDLRAMLRVILARENLSFASPVYAPKFRRPYHFVTTLFRAFSGRIENGFETMSFLTGLGQVPLQCAPPTGYPDTVENWGPLILPRWSFSATLLQTLFGNFRGVRFPLMPELEELVGYDRGLGNRRGVAQRIGERAFGGTLSPREVELLQEYIDDYPGDFDTSALFDCLCLASSMPGFQWY